MKKFLFILIWLTIFGQSNRLCAREIFSSRSSGLSGISVTLDDVHAVFENPALNPAIDHVTLGAGASSLYNIKGLNILSTSFVFPFRNTHALAIHFSKTGTNDFYQQHFAFSYGIKLSPKLSLGAGAERLTNNYGKEPQFNISAWSATLGLFSTPINGLSLGASISNPQGTKWNNETKSALPVFFRFGMKATISTKVNVYTQINKESLQKANYIVGIEYTPFKLVQFRTGISTTPVRPAFGVSFQLKNTSIDFTIRTEQYLGLSSGISIQYMFR